MEDKIKKALGRAKVDYAEIHLEETIRTQVTYAGKELETIGTNIGLGGNARAFHRGGWGFVSFNDPKRMGEYVRGACRQAKLVGRGKGGLVHSEPRQDHAQVSLEDDPRNVSLREKERLCRGYNRAILKSKKITTSVVRYEDTFVRRTFANTDGSYITEERVYVGISLSATAKEGSNVQVGFDSVGDTRGFKGVQGLEGRVETVVKDAIDLLKAEKVPGGTYTVIADPRLAGVFAHEAFGHLSEADHVYENEKLREIMKLGERFGVPELSIVDDGTIFGERGYYKYDDEGVPSHKTYLIKDGLLVGRLHSRETAAQMGEAVTGNARAMNYRFQPIVRMSNTYIEPRNWKFNDMVADTENGIYAVSALGGQTELEMFTFSAAKAYLIKDGKIDRMLRDVILSGNIFETLKNIDAIGDDLSLYGGLGGCGKDSQWPLPVGDGSPHVRVRNVVIGGK
jgi:TldD protein